MVMQGELFHPAVVQQVPSGTWDLCTSEPDLANM